MASARVGGEAAPSLDLRRESVDGIAAGVCPKKPYFVTAVERPDVRFPASCDAYRCPTCGPRKAEQAAAVMTWAIRRAAALYGVRSRLVTLTNAPLTHQQRRQKVRDVTRWARRELGIEWELGWAVETGGKTGMVHIHAVQWGTQKIPQAVLQDRWGAIVDVRAVKTPAAGIYAVKEALTVAGYAVKGGTSADTLAAHLDLNGGRAAHWSRGFLHGMTKREVLGEVRRELADGEALTWVLVPAWS
jgi:hypothetical protein